MVNKLETISPRLSWNTKKKFPVHPVSHGTEKRRNFPATPTAARDYLSGCMSITLNRV